MLPGGAHVMGSGSFEGTSRALAANAPEASSGEAAQYCKNRRRLVARISSFCIQVSSPAVIFCGGTIAATKTARKAQSMTAQTCRTGGMPARHKIQKVIRRGGLRRYFR